MSGIFLQRIDGKKLHEMSMVAPKEFSLLTERQAEVLEQLAAGLSNKEIALRLGLSKSTVKTHILSIYQRTRCSNRIHLAVKWLQYSGRITVNADGPANS